MPKHIRTLAGVDVAYFGNFAVGAAVVLDYDTLDTLKNRLQFVRLKFPTFPLCSRLEKSLLQWQPLNC